jgi:MoaA/NifB/PqqE/SkfB family radical SAM enzyme
MHRVGSRQENFDQTLRIFMASLKEKADLLRGLIQGDRAYTSPFFITVDVSRRCNLRCLGCQYQYSQTRGFFPHRGSAVDYIPVDLVKKLCEQFAKSNLKEVSIMGEGEPLLHPEILEIISTFKKTGLRVSLTTNGTLLDSLFNGLVTTGLDELKVSFWANSLDEYEKNYPGVDKKNFYRVLEGLRLIAKEKATQGSGAPAIGLHMPLNRFNYKRLYSRLELAQAAGCDFISFSCYRPWGKEFASFALTQEEIHEVCLELSRIEDHARIVPLKHNIDELLLRYRLGQSVWKFLPCYIGWIHTRIKMDGTVFPCNSCRLPMGNLHQESFEHIWNGAPYRRFRRTASSLSGLASLMNGTCDCDFCCHAVNNRRVHKIFKLVSPFRRYGSLVRTSSHAFS